jgi:acyl-coenzyme A synthetase/AMP-(fatty) acid ligase
MPLNSCPHRSRKNESAEGCLPCADDSSARESGNANTLRASAEVGAALMDFQYKNNDFDFSGIGLGISAGEALPASLSERFSKRFGFEILDGIGSTEALYIFISNSPGDVRHGSTGRAVPGCELKIRARRPQPSARKCSTPQIA